MSIHVQKYIDEQVQQQKSDRELPAPRPVAAVPLPLPDAYAVIVVCDEGSVWELSDDGWRERAPVPNTLRAIYGAA